MARLVACVVAMDEHAGAAGGGGGGIASWQDRTGKILRYRIGL